VDIYVRERVRSRGKKRETHKERVKQFRRERGPVMRQRASRGRLMSTVNRLGLQNSNRCAAVKGRDTADVIKASDARRTQSYRARVFYCRTNAERECVCVREEEERTNLFFAHRKGKTFEERKCGEVRAEKRRRRQPPRKCSLDKRSSSNRTA